MWCFFPCSPFNNCECVCVWAGWNHRLSMLLLWKLWAVLDPEDKSLRWEWSFWTIRIVTSWGMWRDQLGRETSLPSLSPREKQEDSDRRVTINYLHVLLHNSMNNACFVIVSFENCCVELVFCFAETIMFTFYLLNWDFVICYN